MIKYGNYYSSIIYRQDRKVSWQGDHHRIDFSWFSDTIMRINSSLVLLSKTKGIYWFSNYPHVWIVKTNYTFMSFLTAKFKLIIFWCQFCRVFCHFCQYLFTSNRQIELAHNLLIYRVKAEAERARGTIRTLSNDIWGFLEILEPRKPKQSLF